MTYGWLRKEERFVGKILARFALFLVVMIGNVKIAFADAIQDCINSKCNSPTCNERAELQKICEKQHWDYFNSQCSKINLDYNDRVYAVYFNGAWSCIVKTTGSASNAPAVVDPTSDNSATVIKCTISMGEDNCPADSKCIDGMCVEKTTKKGTAQKQGTQGQATQEQDKDQAGKSGGGEEDPVPGEKTPSSEQAAATTRMHREGQNDVKTCNSKRNSAVVCCGDPMKCLTSLSLGDQETVAMATGLITSGGAALAMGGGGMSNAGLKKLCTVMKVAGIGAAATNAAFAGQCVSDRNQCLQTCEPLKTKWQARIHNCEANPSGCANLSQMQDTLVQLEVANNECSGLTTRIAEMGSAALQSGNAAAMSDICRELATSSANDFNGLARQPINPTDCSNPANKNNPACIDCSGPNAAQNPFCKAGTNLNSNNPTVTASKTAVGARDGSQFNVDDFGDGEQSQENIGGGALTDAKANSIPNNTGGGVGGGGGGANLGSASAGGAGGSAGYNTDVLKGERGGGGYNASSGGGYNDGGGFSGYGGSGYGNGSSTKGIDLKQFLPGGAKDPTRKIAGLGSPLPDLAPKHSDIFKRNSDRVKAICKLNRLIDCH